MLMRQTLLLAAAVLGIIAAAQAANRGNPPLTLLSEFRAIGASGNNLQNPALDPVPGAAELAIAPLNFAVGTSDGPVTGPNARVISNVIAGGTGSNGPCVQCFATNFHPVAQAITTSRARSSANARCAAGALMARVSRPMLITGRELAV
jgi:hypothetical protein